MNSSYRQLGISYNAAWRMKHKLMQVMVERGGKKRLSGLVQIDDAYLGGEHTGGKRGRGASVKTPFVAAEQTAEDGRPQSIKFSVAKKGFRKSEIASWAGQHLEAGSHAVSDGLYCFEAVTQAGCTHQQVVSVLALPASLITSRFGSMRNT